jgi:uncharacterized Fe-S radical SAM superfamily protein PflX
MIPGLRQTDISDFVIIFSLVCFPLMPRNSMHIQIMPSSQYDQEDYLHPLTHCTLCEHRCAVNRLEGETGICRMALPVVASATLHPAPPESYTVFMAGCNYKCLNCQNWTIAQLPDNG